MNHRLPVLVDLPAHVRAAGPLTYLSDTDLPPGTLVRVPLGRRETLGIVWDPPTAAETAGPDADPPATDTLRPILQALNGLAPLDAHWRRLVEFTARYYQRAAGEVALSVLPPPLRELDAVQLARRLRRIAAAAAAGPVGPLTAPPQGLPLTDDQRAALHALQNAQQPCLLFGATGSGKTEVYLQAVADTLAHDPTAQVLVMVPEINLTPQLLERFRLRLQPWLGEAAVVSLHSRMTPAQRLSAWLQAHCGQARVVLGTRMAVFASMPALRLIVVDEEHDPSYKQQEGARYSARDLAVMRAHQLGGPAGGARVLLGSATPSLESWHQSRPGGRYLRLHMPRRVGASESGSGLPEVRLLDMTTLPRGTVLAPALIDAVTACVQRGEQALLFLNRRGYAPVLSCGHCGWKSECPNCSAYRVFHKSDRSLRCHHCAYTQRVPRACPACGNPDIRPLGIGTEQLQEQVEALLGEAIRIDGRPVRVGRIDADTTRAQGTLEQQLAQVHSGEVDILVGTQMIAKGHDFRRVGLVAALNPDAGLYSSDFRAPERLFALLMQAAGRAGRNLSRPGAATSPASVWVQTAFVGHPLLAALRRHDYPAFADAALAEREQTGLPPFTHQALLRADARDADTARAFLERAAAAARELPQSAGVTIYAPVPPAIQRVANIERQQLLVESASRADLQRLLALWHPLLHALRQHPSCKGLLRWAIDVDPLTI